MASFLTAAAAAIGSSNIGSAIVRILVAYGVSRLINKATGNTNTTGAVDQGIRLQAAPDTTNPIPLLYGSAYLGGKITDAQLVDSNKTMWYCLTLAEISSTTTVRLSDAAAVATTVDEIYWNNQRVYFKADGITVDYIVNQDGVVDTSPRDLVKIYLYNGSAGPTRPSDLLEYLPSLPTLHGDARTLMPGWVSDERMLNLTFALVRISYNKDKGITGLPNLQFKVSNNLFKPGDALHSFLRNKISGAGLALSQIDTASLVALNAYADDTVSYFDEDDGQTKTLANRYQINGVINPADNVMNNLQKLAANAGCFVSYDIGTGLWGVTINKDQSAVLAFDDSNIISGIDLTGTNLDSMYNAVEVEFPHRELRDQMDTIRIDLPTEYRNANEPDNILQLKLDLINEPLQARELGYLELYQNRMDQVVTFTTDYSKINTEAGDVITITTDVYAWTAKPFRVVRVREIESDTGGLAVEITAQEYDSTMYTAGGVPRRPRVPSEPIAIPEISVIGTPAAPTVAELNNVAVPALDITGVTPSGIVDRFEYWYSSDAGTTYRILGSRSNSNGSPYAQGTSLTFRAASLPAGSYLFKVRGGNEKAFGEFSATVAKTWAPVQVTDQVTDKTTIDTPSLGDLLPVLGMGAIAYFAYKAFAPQALAALSQTDLGKLLGIVDPAEIAAAQTALEKQSAAFRIINAGNVSFSAGVDDTLTFLAGAGISITANDIGHEITISATGGGTGSGFIKATAGGEELLASTDNNLKFLAGAGITIDGDPTTSTITITADASSTGEVDSIGTVDGTTNLPGSIFPTIYKTDTVSTHNAIFTHGNLVYAPTSYEGKIKNVVSLDSYLYPSAATIDGANRYYSYCDYDSSKELCEQNWGAWKLWKDPYTAVENVPISGSTTNPPVSGGYSVDGEYDCGGNTLRTIPPGGTTYDYFVPDVNPTVPTTVIKNYQLLQVYRGKLLVFGASNHNFADNTSFRENTIFGEQSADYVKTGTYTVTGPDVATITPLSSGSSLYVASKQGEVDSLWYSTDTNLVNWTKVSKVTFSGTSATDGTTKSHFAAINSGTVNGITQFVAVKNQTPSQNEIATSSDGINWIEHGTAIPTSQYVTSYSVNTGYVRAPATVREIVRNGSSWLSDNLAKSSDGINWSFMTGAGEVNQSTSDGGPSGRCVKVIPGYGTEFVAVFSQSILWLGVGQPVAQEPHIKIISSINADITGIDEISYQYPDGVGTYYQMISAAVAGSKYYYYGYRVVSTMVGGTLTKVANYFIRILDRVANTSVEIPIQSGFGGIGIPNTRLNIRTYNDFLYFNSVTNKLIVVENSSSNNFKYYELDPSTITSYTTIPLSALTLVETRANHSRFKDITSTKVAIVDSGGGAVVYNKSQLASNATVGPTTITTVGSITGEPIAYKTNYCFPGAVGANPRVNRVGDYGIGNVPPACVNYKVTISSDQISTIP